MRLLRGLCPSPAPSTTRVKFSTESSQMPPDGTNERDRTRETGVEGREKEGAKRERVGYRESRVPPEKETRPVPAENRGARDRRPRRRGGPIPFSPPHEREKRREDDAGPFAPEEMRKAADPTRRGERREPRRASRREDPRDLSTEARQDLLCLARRETERHRYGSRVYTGGALVRGRRPETLYTGGVLVRGRRPETLYTGGAATRDPLHWRCVGQGEATRDPLHWRCGDQRPFTLEVCWSGGGDQRPFTLEVRRPETQAPNRPACCQKPSSTQPHGSG
ncbi:unnamed protein product [Boreogadus saida]